MKTFTRGAILALVVAITFTAPSKSWGQGKGGGGSGGGTAQAAGALYGDLYVIERDGNGVPVTRTIDKTGGPYICQQPLKTDCSFLRLNGDKTDFNPEVDDACAVQAVDADFLQAVCSGGRASPGHPPRSSTSRTGRPSSRSTWQFHKP